MTTTASSSKNPVEAIQSAISQGQVSLQTGQMVLSNLNSGDEQLDSIALSGCQGIDPGFIDSEEVVLVACVIDASGSMESHRDDVIDAYKEKFLKPLQGAKNARSILITTWLFSERASLADSCRLLHGFTPAPDCPNLTKKTYDPDGNTPLWDAVNNAFTGMIAYGQTLRDSGTRTKCIVVVISDGENNCSIVKANTVKKMAEDLLKQEIYVLSYIFYGRQADGDRYADEIGFPARHRLTDNLDAPGIRRVFGTLSSSIISASQPKVSVKTISSNPFFQQNQTP